MEKIRTSTNVFVALLACFAILMGIVLGLGLAYTRNTINTENFTEFETSLPTKILDSKGELITEFSSEEIRDYISLKEIPQHMLDALITREDRIFYDHNGFSIKALVRAVLGQVLHISLGGGSTLTQQIAGTLYADRREMSMMRKLRELWWAIQMERRYSKTEILEIYLNRIYFGGGTYGVNAASKFYFGHDARQITPAESAILVIQLSNPAYYNPFDHPNRARDRQKDVLRSMVKEGYITQAESDTSFDAYWLNFDFTRTNTAAFFMRDDKAPWFSEYVRRELSEMIYGDADIYRSGFTVYTSGNLYHLKTADSLMKIAIERANQTYKKNMQWQKDSSFATFIPMSELIALTFNLNGLKMTNKRVQTQATSVFTSEINPIIDVMALLTGNETLKTGIINRANTRNQEKVKSTIIEGTMVNIENDTGYITAIVGGSKYGQDNQFIRATQARVQPGSSFKPLYYSAAIDSKRFTAATKILDAPYEFKTAAGDSYLPNNYGGAWRGNVLTWRALSLSLNIPALKVLEGIGFDSAIERSVSLLGISSAELPSRAFIPGYPLGLGVCSVRPVEMARAYAIFANGGKAIKPSAIKTVEDKEGNIILNPEAEIRANIRKPTQVITPQNSFIMTKMLETATTVGTLRYGASNRSSFSHPSPTGSKFTFTNKITGKTFDMPVAGKTGTTQNWGDAWACGYTPYYTAVFWFGFDTPGMSMGTGMSGASLAGPPWGDFMEMIHKQEELPYKDFPQPEEGVVKQSICDETGLIATESCPTVTLWFLAGTDPKETCTTHGKVTSDGLMMIRLQNELYQSGHSINDAIKDDELNLDLNLDFLQEDNSTQEEETTLEEVPILDDGNFLLD